MWLAISAVLAPIIGYDAMLAMFNRCQDLCRTDFPWLSEVVLSTSPANDFLALGAQLQARPPGEALAASEALMRTFYDLLSTMIGPTLVFSVLDAAGATGTWATAPPLTSRQPAESGASSGASATQPLEDPHWHHSPPPDAVQRPYLKLVRRHTIHKPKPVSPKQLSTRSLLVQSQWKPARRISLEYLLQHGRGERKAEIIQRALVRHTRKLRQVNTQLVTAMLTAQITTDIIRQARDQMGYMAHHDPLTNLPNRVLLMDRLILAIALARRQHSRLAVLFIDLDRFKVINDSLGHGVGDLLLQTVGHRLQELLRTSDTASRQGGDEFIVLLSEVSSERAVAELAEKLCLAIAKPYHLGGAVAHIGCTIGISLYPDDGDDAELLIQNADLAMYHGKHNGRNHWYFYRNEMNQRAIERQRTEADLHQALLLGEFEVYYQARVNLRNGKIAGAEALLRWHRPAQGIMGPARFIPIAEECGLIVPIGLWVMRQVCRQIALWKKEGLAMGTVAMNISALEFRTQGFSAALRNILSESGISPTSLELEITEGVLMSDTATSGTILRELKEIGVQIAIDDFGTGYSSLSYLTRFPIDVLKIDQSFIRDIDQPSGNGVIVDAVIAMGKSLGQRVVAEGVEHPSQLAFLRKHHCHEGQGYLFSKPLPVQAFAELMRKNG